MNKHECDLCGKPGKDIWLSPLTEQYKTDDVQEVCDDCLHELNKYLSKIDMALNKIKNFHKRKFWEKIVKRLYEKKKK